MPNVQVSDRFDDFPKLNNLKQLELVLRGWDKRGGLRYATLVKKCPMLYRLCAQDLYCSIKIDRRHTLYEI
ncbi:hypothetical protein LguiB_001595 [Lonicera macranthoides]